MDQPGLSPPAAPPTLEQKTGKRSMMSKLAGAVGRNPYASLAVIIVLTIVVISLYVYYHGFLKIGPYASGFAPSAVKGGPKSGREPKGSPPDSSDSGDPETERLIAAINNK